MPSAIFPFLAPLDRRGSPILPVLLLLGCVAGLLLSSPTPTAGCPGPDHRYIIGISLGSSHIQMSIIETNGRVTMISGESGESGKRNIPAIVAFLPDGSVYVADEAEQLRQKAENNTLDGESPVFITGFIDLLGRTWSDPVVQRAVCIQGLPLRRKRGSDDNRVYISPWAKLVADSDLYCGIETAKEGEKLYSVEEVTAMLLGAVKEAMGYGEYEWSDPLSFFVSVPSDFNNAQRQAVRAAFSLRKLPLRRIITDPVAATFAYDLNSRWIDAYFLVVHMGAQDLQLDLVHMASGDAELVSTRRVPSLGDSALDDRTLDFLLHKLEESTGAATTSSIRQNPTAMARLRRAAEQARRALTTKQEYHVQLDNLLGDPAASQSGSSDTLALHYNLTRAEFEPLMSDLLETAREQTSEFLRDRVKLRRVRGAILVGETTRTPAVQAMLRRVLGNDKELLANINPDEVLAIGAAKVAALEDFKYYPPCKFLLPDLQIPQALGFETARGLMEVVLPAFAFFPIKRVVQVSTATDNQTSMTIRILRGDRLRANMTERLGEVRIDNIPPAPRGVPRVEIVFELDARGDLRVSGRIAATQTSEDKNQRASQPGPSTPPRPAHKPQSENPGAVMARSSDVMLSSSYFSLPGAHMAFYGATRTGHMCRSGEHDEEDQPLRTHEVGRHALETFLHAILNHQPAFPYKAEGDERYVREALAWLADVDSGVIPTNGLHCWDKWTVVSAGLLHDEVYTPFEKQLHDIASKARVPWVGA